MDNDLILFIILNITIINSSVLDLIISDGIPSGPDDLFNFNLLICLFSSSKLISGSKIRDLIGRKQRITLQRDK